LLSVITLAWCGNKLNQEKSCEQYKNEIEKKLEVISSWNASLYTLFYSPTRKSCIAIEIDNISNNYQILEYPDRNNGPMWQWMWFENTEENCSPLTGTDLTNCTQAKAEMNLHIQMLKW